MNLLTKLPVNSIALDCLRSQGFDWQSTPEKGVCVYLCRTANLSTGGTARDVTDEVHPEIRELAERVARIVDLDICGIDLIHPDIRKGICASTAVIEVNAGPGLRMHLAPTDGKPRDVGGAIIESLFPNGENGRIPLVSITGTNGKTTVARLLAHTISQSGKTVGHTTSNGIYISGQQIAKGDLTGPFSAQAVLSDPRVEFAVLETARGGIMRGGLGYPEADVAIITNIRPDHIGQDGIESLEDIVNVKALVAEQVRDGGTLILNADDEEASKLVDRPRVRAERKIVCYYSLSESNPLIEQARRMNRCCYFLSRGWLVESKGETETRVVAAEELPMTFKGTSNYQISNALAVLSAARAFGMSLEMIRAALKSFAPQIQNLGRGSLYKVGEGHLFLDYGHNPDAIAAVADTIRSWRPRRLTAVVGLPGDRRDDLIRESVQIAASKFDQLIFRDDYDRRGRAVGEVPLMALQIAEQVSHRCEASIILDEEKAIGHVIENLRPGDVAVVFYDELENALEVLRRYDPVPVTELPNFLDMIEEKEIADAGNATYTFSP